MNEVRDALRVFASQPNLAAIVVAGYNPDLDADGAGARKLIDLLADVLSTRLEATSAATAGADVPAPAAPAAGAPPSEPAAVDPLAAPEPAAESTSESSEAAAPESSEAVKPDASAS